MSLDPEKLITDLNSEDDVGLLLRGHLYIERELVRLLEFHLKHPDLFDTESINFPKKIYLAGAMGILTTDEIKPYMVLNKLRNQLAHNLDSQIMEKDIRGLVEALNERQLTMMSVAIEARPPQDREGLRHCILILFLYLFALLRHQKGEAYDELTEWKRLYS